MTLHKFTSNDVTLIQNQFIDHYMIQANGEFVKVYLYLLRCSSDQRELSLSSIADALNHTENDVRRALSYWEKLRLLSLTYDASGSVTDIVFLEYGASDPEQDQQKRLNQYAADMQDPVPAPVPVPAPASDPVFNEKRMEVSPDRRQELASQEEVRQLLFIAEQFLARQLSSTEVNNILYFYDELRFSSDLIEYLIEYCVSKGKRSMNYIRKVALEWTSKGISTVEAAKKDTNLYRKEYYTILNAFGIQGRGPAQAEIDYMARWYQELGFTTDLILEACRRTITRIHTPSFPYADSILQDWKTKGIRHLCDLESAESADRQEAGKKRRSGSNAKRTDSGRLSPPQKTAGKFGFSQREYDFEELEQQLLDC